MERNRNTGNRIFEIKLFALCMCGSDLIFVIENSLCEVINCFFGKLRGCDQSSFDSNCLNIIVNALIGAARTLRDRWTAWRQRTDRKKDHR